jgi:LPXTG-site transpeptidase (sortase) family protein
MPKKEVKSTKAKSSLIKQKIFVNLRNKIIGLVLLLLGFLLLTGYSPFYKTDLASPIKIGSNLINVNKNENIPVRVVIPNVKIDNVITPSRIINGYWELSENTASYGEGSGTPGQKGNVVVFAHAREGLFYNLKDVKKGNLIYLFTKDKWYKYSVNKITSVYPNQVETIAPTKNETLTLYTCTGFYDEKRLIIVATPGK